MGTLRKRSRVVRITRALIGGTILIAGLAAAAPTVAARTQKSNFLRPNGAVTDACAGQPCHTDAFTP